MSAGYPQAAGRESSRNKTHAAYLFQESGSLRFQFGMGKKLGIEILAFGGTGKFKSNGLTRAIGIAAEAGAL